MRTSPMSFPLRTRPLRTRLRAFRSPMCCASLVPHAHVVVVEAVPGCSRAGAGSRPLHRQRLDEHVGVVGEVVVARQFHGCPRRLWRDIHVALVLVHDDGRELRDVVRVAPTDLRVVEVAVLDEAPPRLLDGLAGAPGPPTVERVPREVGLQTVANPRLPEGVGSVTTWCAVAMLQTTAGQE